MSASSRVKREYFIAVLAVAGGALLSWWALSRPWLTATEALLGTGDGAAGGLELELDSTITAAQRVVEISGSGMLPAVAAMPVLLLAGIAAVIGSRGWGRRITGGLIAAAAAVIVIGTFWALFIDGLDSFAPGDAREVTTDTLAPVLAMVGGVIALLGGIVIGVRGPTWPGLGRSYERSSKAPRDAWEALDRGIDPTLDAEPEASPGTSPGTSTDDQDRPPK
mgnify:FL=1